MPSLPDRYTEIMAELVKLQSVRTPALRDGRVLNTNRSLNMEAYMGQLAGRLSNNECIHCTRGAGPWDLCVVAEGYFGGSCTNCHYNNKGARCSLRKYSPFRPVSKVFGCLLTAFGLLGPDPTSDSVRGAIGAAAAAYLNAPAPSAPVSAPVSIPVVESPPNRRPRRIAPVNISPTPRGYGSQSSARPSGQISSKSSVYIVTVWYSY